MPNSVLDRPYFLNEAAAYAKLESIVWPNGPVCVHCGGVDRIGLLKGSATRPGLYKCYQSIPCSRPATSPCTTGYRPFS
jgi:hypothetical protein